MSAYLYLFLQSVSEGSQVPVQEHPSPSQTDQNLMRSDAKFSYEMSVNGQTLHRDYLDAHIQQGEEAQTVISSGTSETQVNDSYSLFCYFPGDLCKILMITILIIPRFLSQSIRLNLLLPNKIKACNKFLHSSLRLYD